MRPRRVVPFALAFVAGAVLGRLYEALSDAATAQILDYPPGRS